MFYARCSQPGVGDSLSFPPTFSALQDLQASGLNFYEGF